MSVLPGDYDADPSRFLASEQHPHDDVHPSVAARFAAAGARTVLDVGDGNRLPIADASIDAVAALYTLYHVHRLSVAAASAAARTVDLPLTLTARGCVVYATKTR